MDINSRNHAGWDWNQDKCRTIQDSPEKFRKRRCNGSGVRGTGGEVEQSTSCHQVSNPCGRATAPDRRANVYSSPQPIHDQLSPTQKYNAAVKVAIVQGCPRFSPKVRRYYDLLCVARRLNTAIQLSCSSFRLATRSSMSLLSIASG